MHHAHQMAYLNIKHNGILNREGYCGSAEVNAFFKMMLILVERLPIKDDFELLVILSPLTQKKY